MITELEVETLNGAAHDLAALKAHHTFVPCDINGAGDATCASKFIDKFGEMAFRRPLDTDEQTWLRGVYTKVSTMTGVTPAITFRESIDAVAEVIRNLPRSCTSTRSVSPTPCCPRRAAPHRVRASHASFVFAVEHDARRDAPHRGRRRRARYVGWRADSRRASACRFRARSRWCAASRPAGSGWMPRTLHPALETIDKNKTKFAYDNAGLRAAMRKETESLYEHVFFEKNGLFKALLTSTDAYVNGPLAKLYGVQGGPATADQ